MDFRDIVNDFRQAIPRGRADKVSKHVNGWKPSPNAEAKRKAKQKFVKAQAKRQRRRR